MERDRSSVARSGGWGTTWVSAGVQRAFDSFDANRSGFLDYRELRTALRQLGFASDTKTAVDVLRRYDSDANGRLDVGEFNTLVHELLRHEPVSASVRRAFDAFDRNKNGYLEARELRAALRQMGFEADASATLAVLRQFDDDLNGRLDLGEFHELVWELRRAVGALDRAAARAPYDSYRAVRDPYRHRRSEPLRAPLYPDDDYELSYSHGGGRWIEGDGLGRSRWVDDEQRTGRWVESECRSGVWLPSTSVPRGGSRAEREQLSFCYSAY